MNKRHEFFQRFQNHDTLRYAPEPERTSYMKTMWNLWKNPPKPEGRGAASLLARFKGR